EPGSAEPRGCVPRAVADVDRPAALVPQRGGRWHSAFVEAARQDLRETNSRAVHALVDLRPFRRGCGREDVVDPELLDELAEYVGMNELVLRERDLEDVDRLQGRARGHELAKPVGAPTGGEE